MKKHKRIKTAKRKHHNTTAKARKAYWREFSKPRSVMESIQPVHVLPSDEVGFTMAIEPSTVINMKGFIQPPAVWRSGKVSEDRGTIVYDGGHGTPITTQRIIDGSLPEGIAHASVHRQQMFEQRVKQWPGMTDPMATTTDPEEAKQLMAKGINVGLITIADLSECDKNILKS